MNHQTNHNLSKKKQSGVTLLMSILMVVIVTSLLVSIGSSTFFDIRRSGVLNQLQAAQAYNESAIKTAKQILKNDSANVDSREDSWYRRLPPFPVDGGEVKIHVNENSSKLNLFAITRNNEFYQAALLRLCRHVDADQDDCQRIIKTLQTQPIYSLLGIIEHTEISEETINRLFPYVSFFDVDEKININLVSEEVFAAINNISVGRASTYLQTRNQTPIAGGTQGIVDYITQITDKLGNQDVIEYQLFDTRSRFFQIVSHTTLGDATQTLLVDVQRFMNGDMIVLSRRMNKLNYE